MNDKYDLTIIIPHHNTPESLSSLLDSIGSHPGLQVIVVDDHSDRKPGKPAECREGHEDCVLFLENKTEIRGAGKARNIGLEHALGKWLLFADADDRFRPDWYSLVLPWMKTGADLVYFAPDSVNTDTGKPSKRHVRNRQLVEDFLNHVQGSEERLRYRYWVPWSKLIRSDVVRKNRIRFDEIMYSNDIMFSVKTGYYAKTIAADSNVIYCVTEHAGSLTRNPTADVFCRRKEVECRCQLFLMERLTDENLKACGKTRFPNAAIDALRDGHGPGTLIRLAGIFAKYGLLWRF